MTRPVTIALDKNGVATVTLSQPKKHNVLNETSITALGAALDELESDANVRIVILAAQGPTFCSGLDLRWVHSLSDSDEATRNKAMNHIGELLYRLYALAKPCIARVQGPAFGGGIGLLCCCDFVIATEDVHFTFSEAKLGITPAIISPYVIRAMGARHTLQYFLSTEKISAEQALQLGLVDQLVTTAMLETAVAEKVQALLQGAPDCLAKCKQLVDRLEPIDEQSRKWTTEMTANSIAGEEGRQGIKAFIKRSLPDWQKH
ncbi:MAG: enoyl-CoA hydratase-related protein [Proteobacteria bacterium]|nr:enoyl-CoA hydratase-related protein [Pseudomonadota bacterium]